MDSFSRNQPFGSQFSEHQMSFHPAYLNHISPRHHEDDDEDQFFGRSSNFHPTMAHFESYSAYSQPHPRAYFQPSSYMPMGDDDGYPQLVSTRSNSSTGLESISQHSNASDSPADYKISINLPLIPPPTTTITPQILGKHPFNSDGRTTSTTHSKHHPNHINTSKRRRTTSSSTSSSSSTTTTTPSLSSSSTTAVSCPSPSSPTPTTSTTTTIRPHCSHPTCLSPAGQPQRFFSRRADVTRHERSIHQGCTLDCTKPRCGRKGNNGFTRKDHLVEHLRQYHGESVPRRGKR